MFKRVLVALDGSAASTAGFKAAMRLAGDQDARLVGLHVIDLATMAMELGQGFVPPSYVDALYDSLRKNGERVLARAGAAAAAAGVDFTPVIVESGSGTVAQAILAQARKSKADVIVIGTHGRRGFSRILMGSDAEAVLREATVPVLLVRKAERAARKRVAKPRRKA